MAFSFREAPVLLRWSYRSSKLQCSRDRLKDSRDLEVRAAESVYGLARQTKDLKQYLRALARHRPRIKECIFERWESTVNDENLWIRFKAGLRISR